VWSISDFPVARLDDTFRLLEVDFFTMPADEWRAARLEVTIYNRVTAAKAKAAIRLMRLWFASAPLPTDEKLKKALCRVR